MYKIRQWSVTHSRKLEAIYYFFEPLFIWLFPLWQLIGRERVEKPMRLLEKAAKSLMFDCQMCGQCVLSSTGMSCPMNCPKSIRNGPCGGVRLDGYCEVKPEMRCVWVEACSRMLTSINPLTATYVNRLKFWCEFRGNREMTRF